MCQGKIGEIENESFRRVFKEMATNAFKGEVDLWAIKRKRKSAYFSLSAYFQDTSGFLHYDELYQIITENIDKFNLPTPVLVSWLTGEERDKVKEEIEQLPDISTIKDQFENINAEYPEVNYNYFAELDQEKTTPESFDESKNGAKPDLTKITSVTSSVDEVNENIFSRSLRWLRDSRKHL